MKEIGRRLKARREELGLTIEQAQAETKIRRRYIEALEAGKEDPIPGDVYVKGFLRFYANFLELDGPAIVKEYSEWKHAQAAEAAAWAQADRNGRRGGAHCVRVRVSPASAAAAMRKEAAPRKEPATARGATRAKQPGPATEGTSPKRVEPATALKPTRFHRDGRLERVLVSAAVVLILVVAAALWYTWSHDQPAAGGDTGSGSEAGPPAGGEGSPGEKSGGGSAGGTDGGAGSGSVPHWAVASESAGSATYVVYGAPFTVSVEIVSERCWLQVTADGQTVFEKTLDAGVTGQWTAQKSLVIRLGRPQLVKLSVDGQPLGLAGTKDEPRSLEFEAGSPPSGGAGTGGEGTGQAGSGGG